MTTNQIKIANRLVSFTEPPFPPRELIELDTFVYRSSYLHTLKERAKAKLTEHAQGAKQRAKKRLREKAVAYINQVIEFVNARLVYEEATEHLNDTAKKAAIARNELRKRVKKDEHWKLAILTVVAAISMVIFQVMGVMALWRIAKGITASVMGALTTTTGAAVAAGEVATVQLGTGAAFKLSEFLNDDPKVVRKILKDKWDAIFESVCGLEMTKGTQKCRYLRNKGDKISELLLKYTVESDRVKWLNEKRMGVAGFLLYLGIQLSEDFRHWGIGLKGLGSPTPLTAPESSEM